MTDYPITELCELSKQLNHEGIDAIIVNLKHILQEKEEDSDEQNRISE